MDLATLSDDELAANLDAILAEQERRQRLATIPTTIAALAVQYVAGGGDKGALETALEEARPVVTDPTSDAAAGAVAIVTLPVD